MPTRSEVIAALKARYDSQITGGESAQIEQAIAKLAIACSISACQQNEYFNTTQLLANPTSLVFSIALNSATQITFYNQGSVTVFASIAGSSSGLISIPPLAQYTVKAANGNYMDTLALYTADGSSIVTFNYTSTIFPVD